MTRTSWLLLAALAAGCSSGPPGPVPGDTPPGQTCDKPNQCGCWECTCKGINGPGCADGKDIATLTPVTKANVEEFAKKWDKWLPNRNQSFPEAEVTNWKDISQAACSPPSKLIRQSYVRANLP